MADPGGIDPEVGSSRPRRSDLTPRERKRAQREAKRGDEPPGAPPGGPSRATNPANPASPAEPTARPRRSAGRSRPKPKPKPKPKVAGSGSSSAKQAPGTSEPRPAATPGTSEWRPAATPGTSERRIRSRTRTGLIVVLMALLAAGAVTVALLTGLVDRAIELVAPDTPVAADAQLVGDRQPSLVLVSHDEDDPTGQASGLVVLAYDRETERGSIVLVPTAILADVPGYGSFQLREAFALGGAPLVDISLANLMGLQFDGAASVSVDGWATLLGQVGGYEVDVRSSLVDPDDGSTRFQPGEQFLDGDRLAEYLTFRGATETELETLPRVQDVMLGLLERIAADPALLDGLIGDGTAAFETDEPELARALLEQLAAARVDGRVTTLTLPVATLGSGREDSYRLDAARAEALVVDQLAASRPTEGAGVGRGVQILNGNGVVAIGQQVAGRLSGGGYRIVLTGNADRFDYEQTLIVVYDDTPEQLAVAEDVRERLGVGEIQRSATPQSVVDVTIVVGADFPTD